MPNARQKDGETKEEARLRYNREMREYRVLRAKQGRPLPNGTYDYTRGEDSTYRRKYGITVAEAEELLRSQGDACAICQTPLSLHQRDKAVADYSHLDHCHDTGVVRGVLCSNCNHGIGKFKDRPELLRRAADYLA